MLHENVYCQCVLLPEPKACIHVYKLIMLGLALKLETIQRACKTLDSETKANNTKYGYDFVFLLIVS